MRNYLAILTDGHDTMDFEYTSDKRKNSHEHKRELMQQLAMKKGMYIVTHFTVIAIYLQD